MTPSDQPTKAASTEPGEVEADIARHREDLGETVDELVDRVNVKARAQHKAEETKQRVSAEVDRSKQRLQSGDPAQIAAAAAPVLVAVAALALYRMRQRR